MKKVIPIILVLTMAFAFSITALAEGDVEVLPPVDPGDWNGETRANENLDLELDAELPPDVVDYIGGIAPEDIDEWWPEHDEELLDYVEGYKNSDVYDKEIIFDAVQYIAETWFMDTQIGDYTNPGVGGWITVTNYFLGSDTIKAILQVFGYELGDDYYFSTEYRLITDLIEYDPVTGTLKFYVEDLGMWSMFLALIERGVDPETALRVANARSPKTEDNSVHAGIILLIVLSAATATVVISKKARKHD